MAPETDPTPAPGDRGNRFAMLLLRHGLAGVLVIAGVIGIILGHGRTIVASAGVVMLGIAAMVWLLNWLFRLGLSSNEDRIRDEEARDYYSQHGHWPGEDSG
jgi:hypothetical protein